MPDIPIVPITCAKCNIIFWIAKSQDDRLKGNHESFYCPNGHCLSYPGESDAEKLRKAQIELDRKGKQLQEVTDENIKLKHSNNGYQRFFKDKQKKYP